MHATVRIDRHRVAPLPARSRDDDPERKPKPAEEDRRQDVGDVILLSSETSFRYYRPKSPHPERDSR